MAGNTVKNRHPWDSQAMEVGKGFSVPEFAVWNGPIHHMREGGATHEVSLTNRLNTPHEFQQHIHLLGDAYLDPIVTDLPDESVRKRIQYMRAKYSTMNARDQEQRDLTRTSNWAAMTISRPIWAQKARANLGE